MKNFRKITGVSLVILSAILLTFRFKFALGWSPDFILPVLAVSGFILDIYSLSFLTILTLWILNWHSGLPFELWVFAAVALSAWLGKRFLPSTSWLTLTLIIVAGEVAIYLLAGPWILWNNLGFALSNLIFAVFFGLVMKSLLEWVYGEEQF